MAQNPPLTLGKICEIISRGRLYDPAYTHYGSNATSGVLCDYCKKQNIEISWGYENYDFCMSCLEKLKADIPPIFTEPPHKACGRPYRTDTVVPQEKPIPEPTGSSVFQPPDYTVRFQ